MLKWNRSRLFQSSAVTEQPLSTFSSRYRAWFVVVGLHTWSSSPSSSSTHAAQSAPLQLYQNDWTIPLNKCQERSKTSRLILHCIDYRLAKVCSSHSLSLSISLAHTHTHTHTHTDSEDQENLNKYMNTNTSSCTCDFMHYVQKCVVQLFIIQHKYACIAFTASLLSIVFYHHFLLRINNCHGRATAGREPGFTAPVLKKFLSISCQNIKKILKTRYIYL